MVLTLEEKETIKIRTRELGKVVQKYLKASKGKKEKYKQEYIKAYNEIIKINMPLYISCARKKARKLTSLTDFNFDSIFDEMREIAYFAGVKTAMRYNPEIGEYSTYFNVTFNRDINIAESERRTIFGKIPRYLKEKMNRVEFVDKRLEGELGRVPRFDEVAEFFVKWHPKERCFGRNGNKSFLRDYHLEWIRLLKKPVYRLHNQCDNREIPDYSSIPVQRVEKTEFKKIIDGIMKEELNIREQKIVEYRFGLDDKPVLTLEKTSKIFGVTRERVRQIEVRAIEKLNEALKRRGYVEKDFF